MYITKAEIKEDLFSEGFFYANAIAGNHPDRNKFCSFLFKRLTQRFA